MLSLPTSVRIFLASEPVDMRKSFDALAALVRSQVGQDPMSGHLFVFIGRRRHIARILFWDRCGYCLFSKRLESGAFKLPAKSASGATAIDGGALLALLEGIDLDTTRRRPGWKPISFDSSP
jgi:transposase